MRDAKRRRRCRGSDVVSNQMRANVRLLSWLPSVLRHGKLASFSRPLQALRLTSYPTSKPIRARVPPSQPFLSQFTSPGADSRPPVCVATLSHDRPEIAGRQWTHRAQALPTAGWTNYGQLSTRANRAILTSQASKRGCGSWIIVRKDVARKLQAANMTL